MRVLLATAMTIMLMLTGCSFSNDESVAPEALPNIYDRRSGQVTLEDEAIEIRAREAINNDAELLGRGRINVNAYNGTLLITGTAFDETVHQQIIEKLRIMPGVKRVLDEVDIDSDVDLAALPDDSAITNRIRAELDRVSGSGGFNSHNIKIVTENATVYLMGLVFKEEADLATKITQQIPGVQQVIKYFEYLR
jgi:osmotically-inducible protein OsmY